MENVFSGIIVFFLIMLSLLTLFGVGLESQIEVVEAWQAMQDRAYQKIDADMDAADLTFTASGARLVLAYNGSSPLHRFDNWDVVVNYYDNDSTPEYHIAYLPYGVGGWQVDNIYLDYELAETEVFEPDLLNAGEKIALDLTLPESVGYGQSIQVTVMNEHGGLAQTMARRNVPPSQTTLIDVYVNSGEAVTIDSSMLLFDDPDHSPTKVVFTITSGPTQGTLSYPTQFTQAAINNDGLVYTHGGGTDDSFTFTVSDGVDTVGPFTLNIIVN